MKKLIVSLILMIAIPVFASVSDTSTKRQFFTASGSGTTYTFTMPVNSESDIRVEKRVTTTGVTTNLTRDTDYTIASTGGDYLNGGIVTISPALAATFEVIIIREIVQTQETVSGAINAVSIEAMVDKNMRAIQDLTNDFEQRAVKLPESDSLSLNSTLTNSVDGASRNIGRDENGNIVETAEATTSVSFSAFGESLVDDPDAATARGTLGMDTDDEVEFGDIITSGPWIDIRAHGALEAAADNSVAIQAALDEAYTDKKAILVPSGTWITAKLNYHGQSIIGVPGSGEENAAASILQGLPSQDVLLFQGPTIATKEYLNGTVIRDLKIVVDDSVDASGSFTRDAATVGNAGIAMPVLDYDSAAWTINSSITFQRATIENLQITSLSGTAANATCGIFQQATIYDCVFIKCEISRLAYGFWGAVPESNVTQNEYAPDHNTFINFVSRFCVNPFRMYNAARCQADSMQIYGTNVGNKGIQLLNVTSSIRSDTNRWVFNNLLHELNSSTTGETVVIEGLNHTFNSCVLKGDNGDKHITWDASRCVANGSLINYDQSGSTPTLVINGDNNTFSNTSTSIQDATFLDDNGDNNSLTVSAVTTTTFVGSDEQAYTISRFLPIFARTNDFLHSSTAPYYSDEDLWIRPADAAWNGTPTTTKDTTVIETGEYLTFTGGINFNTVNNRTMLFGNRIPLSKCRVYIKARYASSATTTFWQTRNNTDAATLEGATLSFGTTWSVQHFDTDFSGEDLGDELRITGGVPSVSQDTDLAWIAIVPYEDAALTDNIGQSSGVYDFAASGGAQTNFKLGDIFNNSVITKAWYQIITPFTSGGAATVAVSIDTNGVNEIVTATAYNNAVFNAGYHATIPDGTVANFTTQTTDTRIVMLTVGTADLTAGKIKVWWEYLIGE